MITLRLSAAAACLLVLGCGEGPGENDPPVPVATDEAPEAGTTDESEAGDEVEVSGFHITPPAAWRKVELAPEQAGFIDARFEIAGHEDDDVRLTMSTTGGGVEANIDRWMGQFQQPSGSSAEQETLEVDGMTVTWVDVSGEYQGMGGSPQSDWRMLAAAFHGSPRDFYVKLTGPSAALAQLEPEFRRFIESARSE